MRTTKTPKCETSIYIFKTLFELEFSITDNFTLVLDVRAVSLQYFYKTPREFLSENIFAFLQFRWKCIDISEGRKVLRIYILLA